MHWHKISVQDAKEIIEANNSNEKVASLEEYASELMEDTKVDFENVVGQDSLTRFDTKPKRNRNRKKNRTKKTTAKAGNTTEAKPKESKRQNSSSNQRKKRNNNNNRGKRPKNSQNKNEKP